MLLCPKFAVALTVIVIELQAHHSKIIYPTHCLEDVSPLRRAARTVILASLRRATILMG